MKFWLAQGIRFELTPEAIEPTDGGVIVQTDHGLS